MHWGHDLHLIIYKIWGQYLSHKKKRDGDHILMLIYRTMGILSSSKIFTKHGDKMIFKSTMLSPLKNMAMGTLSPSQIFTKHGDKMIFKFLILSPLKKYDNGDLVSIKNIY